MEWQLLSSDQSVEWHQALSHFAQTDVYFLPEYHQAYELNGDGTAIAFIATDAKDLLFYPFFLRPIENEISRSLGGCWYDIETVKGYSGPLSTSADPEFLASAWAPFSDWCREKGVVAEFIRFNPFLENHRFAESSFRQWTDRDLVIANLAEQDLWAGYNSNHRNMIRKALKSGLTCQESSTVKAQNAFRRLHQLTVARNAGDWQCNLSEGFFSFLFEQMSHQIKLFIVNYEEETVASAVFLVHGALLHYHLGNSDSRYLKYGPNNLLLHIAAERGKGDGCRWLNLGGGRTAAPDDQLLKFKLSISRRTLPYRLGSRIHLREV